MEAQKGLNTMPVIPVAIFGLGRAGLIHLENLSMNTRVFIKYMVDVNMELLDNLRRKFRLTNTEAVMVTEAKKVFEDSEIEAVFISSPTNTHEELIRQALEAKIAVFCEKPIAGTLESVIECYKLAKANKVPLHCSFNRRFDPSIKQARQRVKDEVGHVNSIKTTSRDSPMPPIEYIKIAGGIFHDCAVHDLDLICWILGEWPSTVFALAHCVDPRVKELDDVDVVNIMLRFPSGILGHIDISRHSPIGYDQRLEVAGMKGMLQVINTAKDRVIASGSAGTLHNCIDYSFPQRYAISYQSSLTHFLNLIKGIEEPIVDAVSSINITKLADVCEESYRSGQPVAFKPILEL